MTTSPARAISDSDINDGSLAARIPLLVGALGALIVANAVQLAAGLAQLDLSPPANVLPLLGATIAMGVAAIPMLRAEHRAGLVVGLVVCTLSLIGMGPHKLFLDDGAAIAPLALTGFAFEVAFARAAFQVLRWRA